MIKRLSRFWTIGVWRDLHCAHDFQQTPAAFGHFGRLVRRSEDLLLESATQGLAKTTDGIPSTQWEIRPLDEVVAGYVTAAVTAADGNLRKAARQLKISPSTLYARMKKNDSRGNA
jgi:DNA-binding NtrC family response regulator